MKRPFVFAFALAFGTACAEAPRSTCEPTPGPAVDAPTVCAHLASLRCRFDETADAGAGGACSQAYALTAAETDPADFARLTRCYLEATSCRQIALCSLACTMSPTDMSVDASMDAVVDADDDAGVDAGP